MSIRILPNDPPPINRPGRFTPGQDHILGAIARRCAKAIGDSYPEDPWCWEPSARAGLELILEHESALLATDLGGVVVLEPCPLVTRVRGLLRAFGFDLADQRAVEDVHAELVRRTLAVLHGAGGSE